MLEMTWEFMKSNTPNLQMGNRAGEVKELFEVLSWRPNDREFRALWIVSNLLTEPLLCKFDKLGLDLALLLSSYDFLRVEFEITLQLHCPQFPTAGVAIHHALFPSLLNTVFQTAMTHLLETGLPALESPFLFSWGSFVVLWSEWFCF